jgi:hypothetical protein
MEMGLTDAKKKKKKIMYHVAWNGIIKMWGGGGKQRKTRREK